jgi:hypothetical protein
MWRSKPRCCWIHEGGGGNLVYSAPRTKGDGNAAVSASEASDPWFGLLAFRQGLPGLGYVEGQTICLESRADLIRFEVQDVQSWLDEAHAFVGNVEALMAGEIDRPTP